MEDQALRAAWAEINLSNLEFNLNTIKEKVGETEITGVVKADAYGHGAVQTARVLLKNGVQRLAVATLTEAIELRKAGIYAPIIILGLTPYTYHDQIIAYDLTPVISSYPNARVLSKRAVEAGKHVDVLIALETGMGRIGFVRNKDSMTEIEGINQLPNVNIAGAFSQLATADNTDKTYALEQLKQFNDFCAEIEAEGTKLNFRSLANSAAIMDFPQAYFSSVRPGIILYGYYPSQEMACPSFPLKPVMSIKTNIVYIKKLPAGCSASYGAHFKTQRDSVIGTLPLGYADGLPRALSGAGRVLIHGQYAPIVGNICMDQCMVDLTDIPGVKQYDEAIVMGSQGENSIWADEIAEKTGTITYEVICGFGQRLPKVYVTEEAL